MKFIILHYYISYITFAQPFDENPTVVKIWNNNIMLFSQPLSFHQTTVKELCKVTKAT